MSTIPTQLLGTVRHARRNGRRWVFAVAGLAAWYRVGSLLVVGVLAGLVLALVHVGKFLRWARVRRAALLAADMPVPSVRELWHVWRAELKRLAYVQRQWETACQTQGLTANKQVPVLHDVAVTVTSDVTARLTSSRMGVLVGPIMNKASDIAEVVGCSEVVVTPTAGGCTLGFNWSNPMGRTVHLPDLPMSEPGTIAYGVRRDGTAATVEADKSVLIGGLTGFGKSTIIWAMLADLVRKRVPVRLYVSDPKGGIELTALGRHEGEQHGTVQVMKYAATAEATVEMVADLEKRMRFSQSKQQGRKHTPTAENPLCVLLLDELLPLHEMIGQRNKGPLGKLLYEGRASGYVVWANAQVAHESVLGVLRNFIPQRISVKTKTPQTTDTILGDGASARGALCHLIEPKDKGVGYSDSDSAVRPEIFRAPLVADADIERIALGIVPAGMQTTRPEPAVAAVRPTAREVLGMVLLRVRRWLRVAQNRFWALFSAFALTSAATLDTLRPLWAAHRREGLGGSQPPPPVAATSGPSSLLVAE